MSTVDCIESCVGGNSVASRASKSFGSNCEKLEARPRRRWLINLVDRLNEIPENYGVAANSATATYAVDTRQSCGLSAPFSQLDSDSFV